MIACMDCKHHDDSYGNNCPKVTRPDPLLGATMTPCHAAREGDACGPAAKLFEQRGWFSRLCRNR